MGDIDKLGKMCHHFAFLVNFSWNFVRLWAQSAENFTICPKFGIENWKICKICKKNFGASRRHVGEWKIFMGGPPTQWSFKWWRFWLPWRDFEIFGWGDPRGPPPAASLPLEKTLKGGSEFSGRKGENFKKGDVYIRRGVKRNFFCTWKKIHSQFFHLFSCFPYNFLPSFWMNCNSSD